MELPLLTPDWPALPEGVVALSTRRRGGVSAAPYGDGSSAAAGGGLNLGVHVADNPAHVQQNRDLLRARLPAEPAWLTQVHGVAVLDAARVDGTPAKPGAAGAAGDAALKLAPEADASFSAARGVVCAILTADCLPVLFCDSAGTVVAAAHAGWRGLAGGVLSRTVAAMRDAGAGDILAWLGPAIGPQRFEVGSDVLAAFQHLASGPGNAERLARAFLPVPGQAGKYLADIYALARLSLLRDGVSQVSGGEACTVTQAQDFYSFRRDGVTGRQASLIWRK